ncbi:MAG: hypothetical protein HY921_08475 [Elusimicrobia bacterium]|nr:hypothetical protein [Elusimicrobiota bacterium]
MKRLGSVRRAAKSFVRLACAFSLIAVSPGAQGASAAASRAGRPERSAPGKSDYGKILFAAQAAGLGGGMPALPPPAARALYSWALTPTARLRVPRRDPAFRRKSRRALRLLAQSLKAARIPDRGGVLDRFYQYSRPWLFQESFPLSLLVPRAPPALSRPASGPAAGVQEKSEAPAAPAERVDKRAAFNGIFIQRTLAIAAFFFVQIALYSVALAQPGIGEAGFSQLMAIGALAPIATGPFNGLIANRFSSKHGIYATASLRILLCSAFLALPGLGAVNFGTLLAFSVINNWINTSTVVIEIGAFKRLDPARIKTFIALGNIHFTAMQVALGLILNMGRFVDQNPMGAFYFSAAAHALVILAAAAMIPAVRALPAAAAAVAARPAVEKARGFLARYWREALLLGASIGGYFLLQSTVPVALALVWWISRTPNFSLLWKNPALRCAVLFTALAAALFIPLQYLTLNSLAKALAGANAGSGALLGQFTGAFCFGQLTANATQAPLGTATIMGRKVDRQVLVQALVLGLAASWVFFRLAPGNAWAALAAALAGALLMALSSRMSQRAWIQFYGVGLSFILLPWFFWGAHPALLLSLFMIGLFSGAASVALSGYFNERAPALHFDVLNGIQSSLVSAAIGLGFSATAIFWALIGAPLYPRMLVALGGIFLAAGAAFLWAPRFLPGLDAVVSRRRNDA